MLEPLFDFFLLAAIDSGFKEALMYKYLRAISTSLFLVAFRNGTWWRLCCGTGKKQPRWYRQEYQFSTKGASLVTTPTETTSNKRIPVDTLGLAAVVESVVRVHKEPFYGVSKIKLYNRDGTNASSGRLSSNFIQVLRKRVDARYPQVGLLGALESQGQQPLPQTGQESGTQEQSNTLSTPCENSVDTSDTLGQVLATVEWEHEREQDDNHQELQQINEEQAATQDPTQCISTADWTGLIFHSP